MHALARHHEHAHKGMSGSSELFRFPIEGLEWTYRLLSKRRRPIPARYAASPYRTAHKTSRSSMSTPHIFSEPRGPPGFGPAIRYPLSALAARRVPRLRRYSPPTYCAIARSPPWARGYHNHRSPVTALGTSNGTVDACMIQSKRLRCISLGSGLAVCAHSLPSYPPGPSEGT